MTGLTCDVAVIGGGMAGASVAAQLSGRRSVVVAEAAAAPGEHSTGRSAAAFLPSYGGPVIRALTAASRPLYDAISAELGVPLLRPRPLLWLATDDASEHALAAMRRSMPALQSASAAEARRLCPPLRAERLRAAAVDSSASDVEVASLHQYYLAALRRRGGTLLLRAPAREITRSGGGWRVVAGEHVISCAAVVDAAGAWADDVARSAGVPPVGIRPKLRSAFVSPARYPGDLAGLPLLMDACERWYAKPEAGLILGSPADETDVPPGNARPDELAIAQALDAINDATALDLRTVRRAWAGLRSFVADKAPVVGCWQAHQGFHFLAGQGGYGIQTAPALARLAADVIAAGTLSRETDGYGVPLDSLAPDRLHVTIGEAT